MEILRGKHIKDGHVSPDDWLHVIISLLCHDVGYVKGVCKKDRPEENIFATGKNEEMVQLQDGATDAALTPFHVDRGQLFVTERFGGHKIISVSIISRNIQHTRFPVPKDSDAQKTDNYPGLVRAADLIGQLSDPRYLQKISALFYEFEETGTNKRLGYKTPGDLKRNYHKFYWSQVYPYVKDSLKYLSLTNEGKQILARLYSNVFQIEHTIPQTIPPPTTPNRLTKRDATPHDTPVTSPTLRRETPFPETELKVNTTLKE